MLPSLTIHGIALKRLASTLAILSVACWLVQPALAQAPLPNQGPPPSAYPAVELERVVSPIALYPDPLLAQVLAAATFSPEIPDAARWSDEHHYVAPDRLPDEIAADRLPWDPSVQALLPFPSVLEMMAADPAWTTEIGNAFLVQPQDVMDAVQRMRQRAWEFGYLRSNARMTVRNGPYIEILPVNPAFVVVPSYSPAVVFARPRPGFAVASAINFGFGVTIGARFAPWGWGSTRFGWADRTMFINNARWGRTWANRAVYVHPYTVTRYTGPRPAEQHGLIGRSPREREAQRTGRATQEEHQQEHQR